MSNASFSITTAFSDGYKPVTGSMAVTAPYVAEVAGRYDIPDTTAPQWCDLSFGSIGAATTFILQNDNNQEMAADINDVGVLFGLPPGGLFFVVNPDIGDLPVTLASLSMKGTQSGDGSFSYLILGT